MSQIGAVETPGTTSFVTNENEIGVGDITWKARPSNKEGAARSEAGPTNVYTINLDDQIERFTSTIKAANQADLLGLARAYYGLGHDEAVISIISPQADRNGSGPLGWGEPWEARELRARAYANLGEIDEAISDLDLNADFFLSMAEDDAFFMRRLVGAFNKDLERTTAEEGRLQRLNGLYSSAENTYDRFRAQSSQGFESGELAVAYIVNAEDVLSQVTSKAEVAAINLNALGSSPQVPKAWKSAAHITGYASKDSYFDIHAPNVSDNFHYATLKQAKSLNDIARAVPALQRPNSEKLISQDRQTTTLYTRWLDVSLDGLGFPTDGVELNVAFAIAATGSATEPFAYEWGFFYRFHLEGDDWGPINSDDHLKQLSPAEKRCDDAKDAVFGSLLRVSGNVV